MAVVTAAIGLLPGYGLLGGLAPALLVLLRAGQDVAVGGEYGGSAAFVIEYAPADRRGGYGGWQWATVALGLAAGIGTAAALSATMEGPALRGWGWRLAFLLALPLGLVGFWIRLRTEETPGFRAVQHLGAAARTPLSRALAAALVGLVVAAAAAPLAGRLSDRMGRRPLLLAGGVALLVFMLPMTALILRGGLGGLALGYSLIGLALGTLVPSTFLAELFPTRLRYSGLSLTYGLGSAFFGGTAQHWRPSWFDAPATRSRPPGTPPF
jgi:MFS transporter, MHS family, proline/betaine transporter